MQMAAKGIKIKLMDQPLVKVLKDPGHNSLTTVKYKELIPDKRKILTMTKAWLEQENIHRFDAYHRLAVSNQFIRESRHFIGLKGLWLIFRALLITPGNPKVWDQVRWYIQKFFSKLSPH